MKKISGTKDELQHQLRELVKEKHGLSARIAIQNGWTRSYVSNILGRKGASINKLAEIADIIGVKLVLIEEY